MTATIDSYFIIQDLTNAGAYWNTDPRYLLRSFLLRGAHEAEMRRYRSVGEKANQYKLLMYSLQELSANVDHIMDGNGSNTLLEKEELWLAAESCWRLFMIDQAEIVAGYQGILTYLSSDAGDDKRDSSLAA